MRWKSYKPKLNVPAQKQKWVTLEWQHSNSYREVGHVLFEIRAPNPKSTAGVRESANYSAAWFLLNNGILIVSHKTPVFLWLVYRLMGKITSSGRWTWQHVSSSCYLFCQRLRWWKVTNLARWLLHLKTLYWQVRIPMSEEFNSFSCAVAMPSYQVIIASQYTLLYKVLQKGILLC